MKLKLNGTIASKLYSGIIMRSRTVSKSAYDIKALELSRQELEQVSDLFIRSDSGMSGETEFHDW